MPYMPSYCVPPYVLEHFVVGGRSSAGEEVISSYTQLNRERGSSKISFEILLKEGGGSLKQYF